MSFSDYSTLASANTSLGDGTYIGPNMLRNKVRPALQQLAADGKALSDEVGEVAGEASAAAQAVIDAAVFTVTSASGQSVTTRSLLASIASPAAGQTAYLAETGREGAFIFLSANFSASVTADPYQGIYVAPAAAPTGSSGAWVRIRTSDRLRASWYGIATGNSEATNTTIMSAILAANLPGNVSIVMPLGVIPIRVTIPGMGGSTLNVVEILGEVPASTWFGTVAGYAMGNGGTVLKSTTSAASSSSGGVIEAVAYLGGLSQVKLITRGVTVRANTTQNGIMGYYAQQLDAENADVDIDTWSTDVALPTTVRYGIRVPRINNAALTSLRNVSITGFYVGLDASEHLDVDNVAVSACKYGVELLSSSHALLFKRLGLYRCQTPILVSGACRFNMKQLAIERVNAASEPTHWGLSTYDISDPTNLAKGKVRVAAVLGTGTGAGPVNTFTRNGAGNVEVTYEGTGIGTTARYAMAANLTLTTSGTAYEVTFPAGTDTPAIARDPAAPTHIFLKEFGLYRITFTASFASNATGIRRARLYATAGDALVYGEAVHNAISGAVTSFPLVTVMSITTAGIYIRVQADQSSGGSLDLLSNQFSGVLTVEKISG